MAAAHREPAATRLELGCPFGELGDCVHVPRRSKLGGGYLELGRAHALAVMDVDLARPEGDSLGSLSESVSVRSRDQISAIELGDTRGMHVATMSINVPRKKTIEATTK
jgi:hypothetical protein